MYNARAHSSWAHSGCPVAAPGPQSLQLLAAIGTSPRGYSPSPVAHSHLHPAPLGLAGTYLVSLQPIHPGLDLKEIHTHISGSHC